MQGALLTIVLSIALYYGAMAIGRPVTGYWIGGVVIVAILTQIVMHIVRGRSGWYRNEKLAEIDKILRDRYGWKE